MNYAFIKNNICTNIAVFDTKEIADEFKEVMKRDGLVDDVVEIQESFGIGDKYENGIWERRDHNQEVLKEEPTKTEVLQKTIVELSILQAEQQKQTKQSIAELSILIGGMQNV